MCSTIQLIGKRSIVEWFEASQKRTNDISKKSFIRRQLSVRFVKFLSQILRSLTSMRVETSDIFLTKISSIYN